MHLAQIIQSKESNRHRRKFDASTDRKKNPAVIMVEPNVKIVEISTTVNLSTSQLKNILANVQQISVEAGSESETVSNVNPVLETPTVVTSNLLKNNVLNEGPSRTLFSMRRQVEINNDLEIRRKKQEDRLAASRQIK